MAPLVEMLPTNFRPVDPPLLELELDPELEPEELELELVEPELELDPELEADPELELDELPLLPLEVDEPLLEPVPPLADTETSAGW
jgi:pilus assembly protein FimV